MRLQDISADLSPLPTVQTTTLATAVPVKDVGVGVGTYLLIAGLGSAALWFASRDAARLVRQVRQPDAIDELTHEVRRRRARVAASRIARHYAR